MKKSLILAAALAVGVSMTANVQANPVDAQTGYDGDREVKTFVFDKTSSSYGHLGEGATVKFYEDGTMEFDGKAQFAPGNRHRDLEVKISFLTEDGKHIFDKDWDLDHPDRATDEWYSWSESENDHDRRASRFIRVHKAIIEVGH